MKTRKGDFNDDGSRAVKSVPVEAPVPEADVVEAVEEDGTEDLLSLTRDELVEMAEEEGIEVGSKDTKSDIIAAIQGVVE